MSMLSDVVHLKRIDPLARLPAKGTEGSAYWDLYTVRGAILAPGETAAFSTGWEIAVPAGYFLDIRTRSGLAMKGVVIANAPGTVDEDFRGELKLIVHNDSANQFTVFKGDRLAQCALMPVVPTYWKEVSVLSETKRGKNGHGSTGR